MDDQRKREIKQAVNRCWSSIDRHRFNRSLRFWISRWWNEVTSEINLLSHSPSLFFHPFFYRFSHRARDAWFILRGLSSVIISHGFATHATIFGKGRGVIPSIEETCQLLLISRLNSGCRWLLIWVVIRDVYFRIYAVIVYLYFYPFVISARGIPCTRLRVRKSWLNFDIEIDALEMNFYDIIIENIA